MSRQFCSNRHGAASISPAHNSSPPVCLSVSSPPRPTGKLYTHPSNTAYYQLENKQDRTFKKKQR